MTTHHDLLLLRNFYVQAILHGPEFVRPTMQASPKLIRFSMWPFFHPQEESGISDNFLVWAIVM